MKVYFIGVSRRFGLSSKTGNNYDMSKLSYAIPIENKTTENMTYIGHGSAVREMDIDPNSLNSFKDIKTGSVVDLSLQPRPDRPQNNWIVGIL